MGTSKVFCKDCRAEGITRYREANWPGPRCFSHWNAFKKRSKAQAHETHMARTFELPPGVYAVLYESQGGKCFICRKATGQRKRLAVDHKHNQPGCTHPPQRGCPKCIRALLCGPCNKMIGWLDVPALQRAIEVLTDPPAQKVLHVHFHE